MTEMQDKSIYESEDIHIDDESLKEVAEFIHHHKAHMTMMRRHDIKYSSKDEKIKYLSHMYNTLTEVQYKRSLEKSKLIPNPSRNRLNQANNPCS
jgi:hypothetical protein